MRIPYVAQLLKRTNSEVILVAYRGYSDSEGVPSEAGLKTDSETILDYALEQGNRQGLPVYVLGRSLGGAAGLHAVTNRQVREHPRLKGLILENTFTCIADMVDQLMPFLAQLKRLMLRNHWNSIDCVAHLRVPVYFVRCLRD